LLIKIHVLPNIKSSCVFLITCGLKKKRKKEKKKERKKEWLEGGRKIDFKGRGIIPTKKYIKGNNHFSQHCNLGEIFPQFLSPLSTLPLWPVYKTSVFSSDFTLFHWVGPSNST
jgi:hypothetical protein